jgi:hypothetical protein
MDRWTERRTGRKAKGWMERWEERGMEICDKDTWKFRRRWERKIYE